MSHLSFYILCSLLLSGQFSFSQKKWDGGGGNTSWSNGLNWTGNTVPLSSEDVLLDNSLVSSTYTVVLPPTAVTVKSIVISPGASRIIELNLPATNTLVSALTVNGPGYGMIINSGGVFRNSSGATSGNAVKISDSIKINDDGKYIHSSTSGHAANIQVISAAPGTEKGILELDIPGASSTISLSGRIFGRLIMRAVAAGGTCNYTAAGTSRVIIRNNLELYAGVNLNLNFSDTILIMGSLTQEAGTFNLGNAPRSVAVQVNQNITQSVDGIITETGSGIQSLVIGGSGIKLVTLRGSVLNQVALVCKTTGTAQLKNPVSLPYKLQLKSGRLVTTDAFLLTLLASCTIEADTLTNESFVAGPMRKEGLVNAPFLFPIGKSDKMRWVRLEEATGSFTVEYFRENPTEIEPSVGAGLHHISSVEYWELESAAASSAKVRLSFIDPQSGGVTDLSTLRVARLMTNSWQNAGNINYSGSPGSNGWVSSATAGGFSANTKTFALASSISQENPLPYINLGLTAVRKENKITFIWNNDDDIEPEYFELQGSDDGKQFTALQRIDIKKGREKYQFEFIPTHVNLFYRLRMRGNDFTGWHESNVVKIEREKLEYLRIAGNNIVYDIFRVAVNIDQRMVLRFGIYSLSGILKNITEVPAYPGISTITINTRGLPSGIYVIKELGYFRGKEGMRILVLR